MKWLLRVLLIFFIVILIEFVRHFYWPLSHVPQYPTYDDWDNGIVNYMLPAANEFDQTEKNGFSIIEVTADKIDISMYAWRPEDG